MVVTVRVIQRDYNEKKASFNPRPYFRLFVTWLMEFNSADSTLDSSNFQVQFYNMYSLVLPVFTDLSTSIYTCHVWNLSLNNIYEFSIILY